MRPLGSAGDKGTRGATALSPLPRHQSRRRDGLVRPDNEGWPAGHWAAAGGGCRSSPRSGGSSQPGARRPSQLPAALWYSRGPALLVSVSALAHKHRRLGRRPDTEFQAGSDDHANSASRRCRNLRDHILFYPRRMYMPRHFAITDLAQIAALVDAAQSADLVTFDGTKPVSTLLPVIWDRPADGYGRLLGHIAVANDQWKTAMPGAQALAIVHGRRRTSRRAGTRARRGTAGSCRHGTTKPCT